MDPPTTASIKICERLFATRDWYCNGFLSPPLHIENFSLSVYSNIDFDLLPMCPEVVGSLSKHQLYAFDLLRRELVFAQTFDTILPFVGNLINDPAMDKDNWRVRTLRGCACQLKANSAAGD